jgi:hypothetical protein
MKDGLFIALLKTTLLSMRDALSSLRGLAWNQNQTKLLFLVVAYVLYPDGVRSQERMSSWEPGHVDSRLPPQIEVNT